MASSSPLSPAPRRREGGLRGPMIQAGFPFLADDLLVIEEQEIGWEARPPIPKCGCGRTRPSIFWSRPIICLSLQGHSKRGASWSAIAGFGSFHDASTPLSCIYLASGARGRTAASRSNPFPGARPSSSWSATRSRRASSKRPAFSPLGWTGWPAWSVACRCGASSTPSGFERLPEVVEIVLGSC